MLSSLKAHQDSAENPDEVVFQALIESAGDPVDDQPPPRPENVHANVKEQPTYSKMMAALVDQVKKEVDSSKADDRYTGYVKEVGKHREKVQGLQNELLEKLAELEKEESRKITSEGIRTGFDSSHVAKPKPNEVPKKKAEVVEVLNPGAVKRDPLTRLDSVDSGADADIEEGADGAMKGSDDEESVQASPLGKAFAKIKYGDYRSSLQYISEHPEVLAERETDGLLVEAFDSQLAGKEAYARQCVHQALLLQYCRQLGRDGVGLFFKRYVHSDPLNALAMKHI